MKRIFESFKTFTGAINESKIKTVDEFKNKAVVLMQEYYGDKFSQNAFDIMINDLTAVAGDFDSKLRMLDMLLKHLRRNKNI